MRTNEDATTDEVFNGELERKALIALEQARSTAQSSGSDDPIVIALEELIVQINGLALFAEDSAERIGQEIGITVGSLFRVVAYGQEIAQIEFEANNPVTIAAIKTDGVLRFANPVQRQNLLRQLSPSEPSGGIQFVRPLGDSTDQN